MKKKFLIVFLICCMMFGVASPAFAHEYPQLPSVPVTAERPYYIVCDPFDMGADQVCCYTFSSSDMVRNSETGKVSLNYSGAFGYYVLVESTSGYSWQRYADITNRNFYLYNDSVILEKNFIIYNDDGTIFPPVPPLLTLVAELVETQGQILQAEVVGAMMTLLPFGISCLALLITLPLLLKVLRRFLD